ncbi:hypothetical protein ABZ383_18630 [Streptomyces sp. NPDC005900]|uniref:hypothetical protein n=1 Tax=Streptomyces sp. NPDC005900 TaxID=3154569 RepID=UPI0033F8D8CD
MGEQRPLGRVERRARVVFRRRRSGLAAARLGRCDVRARLARRAGRLAGGELRLDDGPVVVEADGIRPWPGVMTGTPSKTCRNVTCVSSETGRPISEPSFVPEFCIRSCTLSTTSPAPCACRSANARAASTARSVGSWWVLRWLGTAS